MKNVASASRERDARQALADKMVAGLPDPAPGEDPEKQAAIHAETNLSEEVEKVLHGAHLGIIPELPSDTANDDARLSRYIKALKREDLSRNQKLNVMSYTQRLLRRIARLHQV